MRAVVSGVSHYLPERVVTSREVEERVSQQNGWKMPAGMVELLSGVKTRRYAADDEISSDLAARAGLAALEDAGVHPMSLDLMIFAAASHDVSEPSTGAIVQSKIGCRDAASMDVKDACNGFLHALDVAAAMIESGRAHKVLVTSGEVLSPVVDWDIANLAELKTKLAGLTLGDAGAAVVLEATEDRVADGRGISAGSFATAGEHWKLSTVLGGGTLMARDRELEARNRMFACRSIELANLALNHLPPLIVKTRERLGWEPAEIALAVPHQVSKMVITELSRRAEFPKDRAVVTLDRFGNTAAASIPLALSVSRDEGRVRRGDKVVLVGGAAGFSAGVVPVVW